MVLTFCLLLASCFACPVMETETSNLPSTGERNNAVRIGVGQANGHAPEMVKLMG